MSSLSGETKHYFKAITGNNTFDHIYTQTDILSGKVTVSQNTSEWEWKWPTSSQVVRNGHAIIYFSISYNIHWQNIFQKTSLVLSVQHVLYLQYENKKFLFVEWPHKAFTSIFWSYVQDLIAHNGATIQLSKYNQKQKKSWIRLTQNIFNIDMGRLWIQCWVNIICAEFIRVGYSTPSEIVRWDSITILFRSHCSYTCLPLLKSGNS